MRIKRNSNIIIVVILVFFNILIYFNAIKNEFVWDDIILIKDNHYIRDTGNLKKLLTMEDSSKDNPGTGYYRPLINLTYMLDYHLYGLNPSGFRLTNNAFNIASVLTLFFLILLITENRLLALAAALIFSAQAVHVEAVSFIAGRNNVICAFFILLSLYFYIKSVKQNKVFYFVFSMVSLFIGAASKEFAFMVPFIFILYDYCFDEGFSIKKGLKRYVAAFLVILLFILLKSTVIPLKSSFAFESYMLYRRLLTTLPIMFKYIFSQIIPYNLSTYFGIQFKKTFFDISVISSFLFFAALIIILVLYRKKEKLLFFSFFAYLFLLVPVSNIVSFRGTLMADRWLYPASAFYSLFLASLIFLVLRKRRLLITIVTIVFVLFLSVFTIKRNRVFKNNISLFSDNVRTHPESAAARVNLGREYRTRGDYENAEKQYLLAIRYEPDNYVAYTNLSLIYIKKKNNQKALEALKKSYLLKHDFPLTSYNLGVVYYNLGNIEESNKFYNKAISLNPEYYDAYFNLAINYYKQGKYELAIENFQKIVDSSPNENEKREVRRRINYIREKIKAESTR